MSLPIYLDYNATTPVAPEVAAAMLPWIEEQFGNPSSHIYGHRASDGAAHASSDCQRRRASGSDTTGPAFA